MHHHKAGFRSGIRRQFLSVIFRINQFGSFTLQMIADLILNQLVKVLLFIRCKAVIQMMKSFFIHFDSSLTQD